VVGLPARGAHDEVLDAGLLPVAADRDHDGVADLAVVRQHPRPGTRRVTGSHVELWYGRSQGGPHNGPDSNGGGGGDVAVCAREVRVPCCRPAPNPCRDRTPARWGLSVTDRPGLGLTDSGASGCYRSLPAGEITQSEPGKIRISDPS